MVQYCIVPVFLLVGWFILDLQVTMVVTDDHSYKELVPSERLDNWFYAGFNECEPSQLEQLRKKRGQVAPIVSYESNDSDNGVKHDAERSPGPSPALKSRLEALEVQTRLLGEDHPDVVFMMQQLRRLQSKSLNSR